MSVLSVEEQELPMAADDFGALEERVMRAVELVKSERAARAAAEQEVDRLRQSVEETSAQLAQARAQVQTFEREREHVRQRVERLLKQVDEIAS